MLKCHQISCIVVTNDKQACGRGLAGSNVQIGRQVTPRPLLCTQHVLLIHTVLKAAHVVEELRL